jgi:hypothetical protein
MFADDHSLAELCWPLTSQHPGTPCRSPAEMWCWRFDDRTNQSSVSWGERERQPGASVEHRVPALCDAAVLELNAVVYFRRAIPGRGAAGRGARDRRLSASTSSVAVALPAYSGPSRAASALSTT